MYRRFLFFVIGEFRLVAGLIHSCYISLTSDKLIRFIFYEFECTLARIITLFSLPVHQRTNFHLKINHSCNPLTYSLARRKRVRYDSTR